MQSYVPCQSHAIWMGAKPNDWNKVVSDAEKIVGYPTSFMSLRCFLSDELSNVAMQIRKLVGTQHPLLDTARGFLSDGRHSIQTRGLIVLLMSKAAGKGTSTVDVTDMDTTTGINLRQRTLAEITEMIHTAMLIHKGVVNLADLKETDGSHQDMEFGNKMAILSGDFLLASASTGLASLENTHVVETMSEAIRDMVEGEFSPLLSSDSSCLKNDCVNFSDWLNYAYLSTGSLLAKSCQSALELANHDEVLQGHAFEFGKNMAYAYQLNEDIKPFNDPEHHIKDLVSTSAPYIRMLESSGGGIHSSISDTFLEPQKLVSSASAKFAAEECQEMCKGYGRTATAILDNFPNSEAKDALINIINAVTDSA